MTTIKFSRQRESIKNYLYHTTSHPTAAKIYDALRIEYPNISLGTVYRNLNFLVENGDIIKISCDDGSDHYDGNVNPHYHFMCKKCHQVVDLDMPPLSQIDILANANFGGEIEGHFTYFYGTCEKCKNE